MSYLDILCGLVPSVRWQYDQVAKYGEPKFCGDEKSLGKGLLSRFGKVAEKICWKVEPWKANGYTYRVGTWKYCNMYNHYKKDGEATVNRCWDDANTLFYP